MEGAMERTTLAARPLSLRISANSRLSSSVSMCVASTSDLRSTLLASSSVENTGKPCREFRLGSNWCLYTPVTTTSSPGRARSTRSPVKMTSFCRGTRPGGTSVGLSCSVIFWKLRYTVCSVFTVNGPVDWHSGQLVGFISSSDVWRKGPTTKPHLEQLNLTSFSCGNTPVRRVITPCVITRPFRWMWRSSRRLSATGHCEMRMVTSGWIWW
mmetsp:Transcript_24161/g.77560  ORF Transcript_24161/g.77560 Transcript_24161/m.77560 type:complete len:212 (+) Transcript_24161:223-858(+)